MYNFHLNSFQLSLSPAKTKSKDFINPLTPKAKQHFLPGFSFLPFFLRSPFLSPSVFSSQYFQKTSGCCNRMKKKIAFRQIKTLYKYPVLRGLSWASFCYNLSQPSPSPSKHLSKTFPFIAVASWILQVWLHSDQARIWFVLWLLAGGWGLLGSLWVRAWWLGTGPEK